MIRTFQTGNLTFPNAATRDLIHIELVFPVISKMLYARALLKNLLTELPAQDSKTQMAAPLLARKLWLFI